MGWAACQGESGEMEEICEKIACFWYRCVRKGLPFSEINAQYKYVARATQGIC